MTKEEIKDFLDMKAQLEPENEDIYKAIVKALEQEPTTKNDLAVDAISRQAINGYIDYILSHGMGKKKSFDFIKKFVAKLPSVTPQEPILDKIRAEIENHCGLTKESNCRYCSYCHSVMGVREILEIIDKCKLESEE